MQTTTEPREMLTTRELAERSRVCPETVRRWQRAGRIVPTVKAGRLYRYDAATVAAQLAGATEGSNRA